MKNTVTQAQIDALINNSEIQTETLFGKQTVVSLRLPIEVTGNEGQLVNLDNQVNHPDRCIHGKIEVKEAYIKNHSEGSDQDD